MSQSLKKNSLAKNNEEALELATQLVDGHKTMDDLTKKQKTTGIMGGHPPEKEDEIKAKVDKIIEEVHGESEIKKDVEEVKEKIETIVEEIREEKEHPNPEEIQQIKEEVKEIKEDIEEIAEKEEQAGMNEPVLENESLGIDDITPIKPEDKEDVVTSETILNEVHEEDLSKQPDEVTPEVEDDDFEIPNYDNTLDTPTEEEVPAPAEEIPELPKDDLEIPSEPVEEVIEETAPVQESEEIPELPKDDLEIPSEPAEDIVSDPENNIQTEPMEDSIEPLNEELPEPPKIDDAIVNEPSEVVENNESEINETPTEATNEYASPTEEVPVQEEEVATDVPVSEMTTEESVDIPEAPTEETIESTQTEEPTVSDNIGANMAPQEENMDIPPTPDQINLPPPPAPETESEHHKGFIDKIKEKFHHSEQPPVNVDITGQEGRLKDIVDQAEEEENTVVDVNKEE